MKPPLLGDLRHHLVIGHDRHPRVRPVRSGKRARPLPVAIVPASNGTAFEIQAIFTCRNDTPLGGSGVSGDGPGPAAALTITAWNDRRSGGLPATERGATMAYEGMIAETIAINGDKHRADLGLCRAAVGPGPVPRHGAAASRARLGRMVPRGDP